MDWCYGIYKPANRIYGIYKPREFQWIKWDAINTYLYKKYKWHYNPNTYLGSRINYGHGRRALRSSTTTSARRIR